MYQVIKRDGKLKEFDISKIIVAIRRAFEAKQKSYTDATIELLALKVTAHFQNKIKVSCNIMAFGNRIIFVYSLNEFFIILRMFQTYVYKRHQLSPKSTLIDKSSIA